MTAEELEQAALTLGTTAGELAEQADTATDKELLEKAQAYLITASLLAKGTTAAFKAEMAARETT